MWGGAGQGWGLRDKLLLLNRSVVSDSVQPPRRQPTWLPRPWDSPGKNTAVGCHFLLQRMKVKSESDVTQSCLTPSDPMDCSPPASSIHGILQARVLEWAYLMGKKEHCGSPERSCHWSSREIRKVVKGDGSDEAILEHSGGLD